MALASPTKKWEQELLVIWADIIDSTYKLYKKKPTQEVKDYLDGFLQTYTELKERIDTHDYTEEDNRYWKSEAFWREIKLSTYAHD